MKPIYPGGLYPKNSSMLSDFVARAKELKLAIDDLEDPYHGLSPYGAKYLRGYLEKYDGLLAWFIHLMAWATFPAHRTPQECALIDHGAGIGVLTMFAKQLNFGHVVHTDYHAGIQNDSLTIGRRLGLQADEYRNSELGESLDGHANDLAHRIVISNNVIEHVYDPFAMIEDLSSRLKPPCTLMIVTTANPRNPLVVKRDHRIHHKREFVGLDSRDVAKEGATSEPFVRTRARIIKEFDSSLSDETVNRLVTLTRGQRRDDIDLSVKRFVENDQLPIPCDHPTNTCDPESGSWEERLVDPERYVQALREGGFSTKVIPGHYFGSSSRLKRMLVPACNAGLKILGERGLVIAPYYGILASKEA